MPARLHPRPPVDPAALNGTGGTMWTNLGFWDSIVSSAVSASTRSYPSAAAALARRVGAAANLKAGDVLLDYACGFGDSLRLWVDEFSVHRVVGIEPDPSVCRVIDSRIRSWGFADRISVICASAEDTLPRGVADDVSAVVCVDAAYHFRTRNERCAIGAERSGSAFGVPVPSTTSLVSCASRTAPRHRSSRRVLARAKFARGARSVSHQHHLE